MKTRPVPRASTALLLVVASLGAGRATLVEAEQKLYVLQSATDRMSIVDVATNAVTKTIEVGDHPHGLASPLAQDVLYVSAEGVNTLTVVDTRRDEVIARYPILGRRPNEIEVTGDGRFVYVPALGDGVWEVFDTAKKAIVARIPTDGFPHNTVRSPDGRFMVLSPMDRGEAYSLEQVEKQGFPTSFNEKLYLVDAATHQVTSTVALADAPRPIAISPDGRRLYVNRDGLVGFEVVDLEKRAVIATAEYGLDEEERAEPSRAHGIGVTPDGREVWSTDVNHGLVFVFDVTGPEPRQVARIEVGRTPLWLTLSTDGKRVFVSNTADDTVSVIDAAAKREVTRIEFEKGWAPKRILALDVPAAGATPSSGGR